MSSAYDIKRPADRSGMNWNFENRWPFIWHFKILCVLEHMIIIFLKHGSFNVKLFCRKLHYQEFLLTFNLPNTSSRLLVLRISGQQNPPHLLPGFVCGRRFGNKFQATVAWISLVWFQSYSAHFFTRQLNY